MSIMEADALDMSTLLLEAYDLGDRINHSAEMVDFLYWKHRMNEDAKVGQLLRQFQRHKELFEECERFGHFHPDYHAAMDAVKAFQAEMDEYETIRQYKEAESRLDNLLHSVTKLIAQSVSEMIKTPGHDDSASGGGCSGGCSSGGSCSGNCG